MIIIEQFMDFGKWLHQGETFYKLLQSVFEKFR